MNSILKQENGEKKPKIFLILKKLQIFWGIHKNNSGVSILLELMVKDQSHLKLAKYLGYLDSILAYMFPHISFLFVKEFE